MRDLELWLERIKSAPTSAEIFQILDEFRPRGWSDEERALMSKTYIAALAKLDAGLLPDQIDQSLPAKKPPVPSQDEAQQEQAVEATSEAEDAVDEEVWYEKM